MRTLALFVLLISLTIGCKKGDTIINIYNETDNTQNPLIGKWKLTDVDGKDIQVFYNGFDSDSMPLIYSDNIPLLGINLTTVIEFKEQDFEYSTEGSFFIEFPVLLSNSEFNTTLEINFLSPQAHWEQIKNELIFTRIGGSDAVTSILEQTSKVLKLRIPILAGNNEEDDTATTISGDFIYTFEKI